MNTIDVGKDFCPRLANRNNLQGDGKHTAVEFREKYLKELDSHRAWSNSQPFVELDFSGVTKIGPAFANEAFAHFLQYTTRNQIMNKILFTNISPIKKIIIEFELTKTPEEEDQHEIK